MISYAALWFTVFATFILAVAFFLALTSRRKRALSRVMWPLIAGGLLFLSLAAFTMLGGILWWKDIRPGWLFPYALSLTAAYGIATGLLFAKAHSPADEGTAARSWPRAGLGAAAFLFLSLSLATFLKIDRDHGLILAGLQKEGQSLAERLAPQPPSEPENSYPLYMEALAALGPELPEWLPQSLKPGFDLARPDVAGWLDAQKEAIDLLEEADRRFGFSPDLNPVALWEEVLPQRPGFEDLARLVALRARLLVRVGGNESLAALDQLGVIQRLADRLKSVPLMETFIEAAAVQRIQAAAFEDVLAHWPEGLELPAPARSAPSDFIQQLVPVLDIQEAGLWQLFGLAARPPDIPPRILKEKWGGLNNLGFLLWRVFLFPSDLDSARRHWSEVKHLAARPYYRTQAEWAVIKENRSQDKGGLLTAVAFPDAACLCERAAQADNLRGLMRLAQAAAAFRAAAGEWPARPDDLVPEYLEAVPINFLSGRGLDLEAVYGGLVLSAGPQKFYLGREAYEHYRVQAGQSD